MKKALITGVTGQDGSYLSELLLSKNYDVHGLARNTENKGLDRSVHLHNSDITDSASLISILEKIQPDEIYNLAAQSFVKASFDIPEYIGNITGLGTLRLLEAVRKVGIKTKIYQAGSSEMFGKAQEVPQKETTAFYPRSPYGAAKAYAHWMAVNYRESYKMFICNGILFNHESPRRGENFVTRKITLAVAAIKLGLQTELVLGNLDARRDWGYAKDFVESMWRMLQQPEPDDFVISTSETHSVREFCEEAFGYLGLDYQDFVRTDPSHFRPVEGELLVGDSSKAKSKLGWEPKTKFKDIVRIMVDADLEMLKRKHLTLERRVEI